jgi:hypothetical protein
LVQEVSLDALCGLSGVGNLSPKFFDFLFAVFHGNAEDVRGDVLDPVAVDTDLHRKRVWEL